MDHAWRPHLPPPPIQGRFCPICSVSHFPFCPPPPPPPFPSNPTSHYHPYQPLSHPPLPPQPAAPYDPFIDHPTVDAYEVHSNDYVSLNPSFDYANVGVKRMRNDDSTGPFVNDKFARFSSANDRRLKLISEFGRAYHDFGNGHGHPHGGKYRDDKNRNITTSYNDPGYCDLERKQAFHERERFMRQQYLPREGNAQFEQLGYDEVDNNFSRKNGYNSHHNVEDDQLNHERLRYGSRLGDGYFPRHKLYHEPTSSIPVDGHSYSHHYSEGYAMHNHMEPKSNHYSLPYDDRVNPVNHSGMNSYPAQGRKEYVSQPPLPASPPPPLPVELAFPERLVSSSPPGTSASFFSVAAGSSAPFSSAYHPLLEDESACGYQANIHISSHSAIEGHHMRHYSSSSISSRGSERSPRDLPSEKLKVVDASDILKHPYRATRPDHLVIILRGLPGSGKSYLAKMIRDLEVENGGTAPRIHSMDDYFMTEVDKVEESEVSKSSSSVRGKKMVTKKVMEYCYEPEMEEAYRLSMLKAFKKTLDEGAFSFIIVDDRNLRVADFAQFWATAKRSGYEVYLLEAAYKDPAGCAARNMHGFTRYDVQKMADQWEETPSMYLKLDVKSLLHGDAQDGGIKEVDMDMEDDDSVRVSSALDLDEENFEKFRVPPKEDIPADGDIKNGEESDNEVDHQITEVKELAKSKWSSDLDEDDARRNEDTTKNLNALSGLIQSYSREGKSVCWGDQVTKRGFSIVATKATNVSLVIGPGAGYNLKSNPLPEEEKLSSTRNNVEPKRKNMFQERLRAEHESFRAVFESFRTGSDKRRHRIVGLDGEAE